MTKKLIRLLTVTFTVALIFLSALEFKAQTETPILEDGGVVHCTCGVDENSGHCIANGDGSSTCKNWGSNCRKRDTNCM